MHLHGLLIALALCVDITAALPADQVPSLEFPLRLIKRAEDDPGQWMTETEIFENLTLKRRGFIDITDITDQDYLQALSMPDGDITVQDVSYPSKVMHKDEATKMIGRTSISNPQKWLKPFTNFHTRHLRSQTGAEAAEWLFKLVKQVAAPNSAIVVEQFKHSFNQPSVIARIPGEKPDMIVIGGHLDCTSGSASARSPGADDNGSGTVTILEILRVLAESGFKPKNTVEFQWYGGEEAGLLGSSDIFKSYRAAKKSILAMVNVDMTAYSPSGKIFYYTDNTEPKLNEYVRMLITEFVGAPGTSKCGYACSDHATARRNGYPSAFVNEETFKQSNPDIHSAADTYDKVQWNAVARHVKFLAAFAVEASYI